MPTNPKIKYPAILITCLLLPGCALVNLADRAMNTVPCNSSETPPTEKAVQFHRDLLIADAHADTLMLDRGGSCGILRKHSYGHLDLPRLQEGNVSFQMLTVVTNTPVPYNEDCGGGLINGQAILAPLQGWPFSTWWSDVERARHQAWKWRIIGDGKNFLPITRRTDLQKFLALRFVSVGDFHSPKRSGSLPVATVLGLEGAHALGLVPESSSAEVAARVAEFRNRGFRVIALTHRFDNELSGASEGRLIGGRRGITPLGRKVLTAMREQELILDLAHLSPIGIEEVLRDYPSLSLMVSHCGVDFRPNGGVGCSRLLSLDHARQIVKRGGMIGIGIWPEALQGITEEDSPKPTADLAARMMRRFVEEFGSDSVCLGSDMDGAVKCAFDAAGYPQLTSALLMNSKKYGLRPSDIRKIMGGNLIRFFLRALPSE